MGEVIWRAHPAIDRVIMRKELDGLPLHVVELIHTHAEFLPREDAFRLSADGGFFMNHSDDPNFEDFGEYALAKRAIEAGDEITCDYRVVKVYSFPLNDVASATEKT